MILRTEIENNNIKSLIAGMGVQFGIKRLNMLMVGATLSYSWVDMNNSFLSFLPWCNGNPISRGICMLKKIYFLQQNLL